MATAPVDQLIPCPADLALPERLMGILLFDAANGGEAMRDAAVRDAVAAAITASDIKHERKNLAGWQGFVQAYARKLLTRSPDWRAKWREGHAAGQADAELQHEEDNFEPRSDLGPHRQRVFAEAHWWVTFGRRASQSECAKATRAASIFSWLPIQRLIDESAIGRRVTFEMGDDKTARCFELARRLQTVPTFHISEAILDLPGRTTWRELLANWDEFIGRISEREAEARARKRYQERQAQEAAQ